MPNCYCRVGFCLFVPLLFVCECQTVTVECFFFFFYLFHCCLSVNAKLLRVGFCFCLFVPLLLVCECQAVTGGLLFLCICSIVVCL